MESFLLYSSNVDAEQIVDIYPMASGIITNIYFDEGDAVDKGTVLAQLDDREASINEQKAKIEYENQKTEFSRQEAMFEKKLISKEEFEKFKYNLEMKRLNWEQTKLLLSYTSIKSPIKGLIANRYVKQGNKISSTTLTFKVIQNEDKIAVVNIPQEEKNSISLNQKVIIENNNKELIGKVKRISPAIDPQTGTFKVTIAIEDPTHLFSVGEFVNIKIIKNIHKNTLIITKEALLYDQGKTFIFVVNDENKAIKTEITGGFENGNYLEILSGIDENAIIITAGKNSLQNGDLVKILEPITTSF